MSQDIVLYDLPSREPCRSWSGNVWKSAIIFPAIVVLTDFPVVARLALNFKSIPYQTKWVPYTRLQETLKATGLEPNAAGSWSEYSVPTIRLPDGSYLMDSAVIAEKLESMYPKPSLLLNDSLELEAQSAIMAVFVPLIPYVLAIGTDKLVAPEDLTWFKSDRASRFGMTVEELETEKDPDIAYAGARAGFEDCRRILTMHKKDNGPFILGSVPCYADFFIVATMQMYKQVGSQFFERFLLEAGPELTVLYDACERWTLKQI